jgi:phenylpropionate dioxygenase-like ring-hydroxylating dioxygenase large terminal subunit/AcrR family transcriptional regulator
MNASTPIPLSTVRLDRRRQLIDATVSVIYRDGLSRLTLAKVAATAGLSTGIVNFYFKSKEQLLLDTLNALALEYETAVNEALDGGVGSEEALHRLVDAILSPGLCDPQKAAVWYAFMGESQAREGYNAAVQAREQVIRSRIASIFCEPFEVLGKSAIEASAIARGFDAMIDSFWAECAMTPDLFDHGAAKATCHEYLRSVLPDGFARPAQNEAPGGGLLAPWTYTSSELFELERDELFHCSWMLIGHVSDFLQSGDYRTLDVGNERAIVVHDATGELRAFHNVCRHRGSRVVSNSEGNCGRAIVCPFHGWTYELDGRLKNVPRVDKFAGLDRNQEGLLPIDLEVWQGFVFVRFRGDGPSVERHLAPIMEQVSPYRLSEMEPSGNSYMAGEVPYNWKIFHDVDNEGYHVPAAHPELQELYGRTYRDSDIEGIPLTTGVVDDYVAEHWSVARYKSLLPEFDHLPKVNQRLWMYIGVFPNLVFYLYPEKAGFYMSLPLDVNRTLIIDREFGLPDQRRETRVARYLSRRIDDITGEQDRNLVQWMHEAVRSSVYPRNNLSQLEQGVADFHQDLRRRIPVMAFDTPPSPGLLAATNAQLKKRRVGNSERR